MVWVTIGGQNLREDDFFIHWPKKKRLVESNKPFFWLDMLSKPAFIDRY